MGGPRTSDARLAQIERVADIGTWTWDRRNGLWWSAQMHRLYGVSPDAEPIGRSTYLDIVHPEDRDDLRTSWEQLLEDGGPWSGHFRITRPDGALRWLHARAHADVDEEGVAQVVGVVRDVTDERDAEVRRRRAHEDLATHQGILQQIVRGQPLAVTLDRMCRDIERRFPGSQCSVMLDPSTLGGIFQ